MGILLDMVRELMAFRRVRVNGVEVPSRDVLEFEGEGVQHQDDAEQGRAVVRLGFAPPVVVRDIQAGDFQVKYAPSVTYIDGPAPVVFVEMPPAQLCGGQTVQLVDLGDVEREIVLRSALGEGDHIDERPEDARFSGSGLRLTLIACTGNVERRSGWSVAAVRERGM